MNIRDLEAFLAVAETGSIVGAAARLNLTQPGVSRRIQTLESLLGVVLLDRQSKPLKPTAAGREAYEYGRRMLRVLDDLKTRLTPQGTIGGEFRLGVTPYLSEVAMTTPLDRLRDAFPELFPSGEDHLAGIEESAEFCATRHRDGANHRQSPWHTNGLRFLRVERGGAATRRLRSPG